MKISSLHHPISDDVQTALKNFEQQFQYPLGEHETFSISHGNDYTAFYRSMGKATCVVAQSSEQQILGTFCATLRLIKQHDHCDPIPTIYLGDLKIDPQKQKTLLFYRMAKYLVEILHQEASLAFGVVMSGTKTTPRQYSGKAGIPLFTPIDMQYILCFNTQVDFCFNQQNDIFRHHDGFSIFEHISKKNYFLPSQSKIRSKIEPTWLIEQEGKACSKLEDTLKAKQLFTQSGRELRSLHLSYFTFTESCAAYKILLQALLFAKAHNYSQLFLALSQPEFTILSSYLTPMAFDITTAHLFGSHTTKNIDLHINTAEI